MNGRLNRRSFLAGAATLPLLTACGGGDSDSAGRADNEVVLWYWNRSIDPQAFRDYEAAHPGVVINDQLVGGDYASRFNTVLAGRSSIPDIVALNDDVSRYFPDANQFANLYDYGAADIEDQFLPWKWKLGQTVDGKMIALPMDTGPLALYYRADMFEAAGLPTEPNEVTAQLQEWDDYFAIGPDVQAANPGVSLMDNARYLYLMSLMQSPVFYVNEEEQYVGEGEYVVRAWDTAMKAFDQGLGANIDPFSPDWTAGVSTGRFASFVGAVWMKQFLIESLSPGNDTWRVAQTPGGPGNQGGSFIGITETARNKELCYDIITTIMNADHQTAQYTSLSLFPSAIASLESSAMDVEEPEFGGQPTALEFVRTAKELQPFYFPPEYTIAHAAMNQQVQNVILGGADRSKAWETGQKQAKRELRHKAPWVTFDNEGGA